MQQNIIQIKPIETIQNKVRVAAYVRVSTSKEDQLNSFAAQYLHYKKMFEDSSFEELIDVYVDEGISGTTTDKRNEFNRMIDDCERGRIQKIYVKSVSRFGRNTAESLAHIRYLKTLGISVFFEKENLDTAIEETEFRLTMMEYHAQEESISISKNVRIGEKYRMERGDYILKVAPYGYERYERTLVVNEAEAEIIKRIYQDYTSGKSIRQIVRDLNTEQIPRKDPTVPWKTAIVKYILTNEKYIGDQMYLKRYRTEDFPFKRVRNHGEHEYYYIEESHEPIISRTVFEYAQKLRIDEETYHRKSNELNNSMGSLRSKRRQFLNNSQADQAISEIKRLASLIDKGPDKIEELDEDLLDTLIEDINIDTSDEIKFKLVGGLVLKEHIERTHR